MRTVNWTLFAARGARFRSKSGTQLSRPVRLHAERLEDRLMMSGNDPDDGTAAAVAKVVVPAPSIDVVSSDASPGDVSLPASTASDTSWARFASTAEFENWLIEAAVAEWGHLFGRTTSYPGPYTYWPTLVFRDTLLPGRVVALASGTNNDAALTTNVQVEGVDEADLIETDGEYLYIISGKNLVIVEAGEGENLRVVSRLALEGRPVGMYLSGDRLAIVSSKGGGWRSGDDSLRFIDIDFTWHEPEPETTTVTVLDISDRAAPSLVQKTEMDGRLVSSRTVDGQLRLVLNNQFQLPAPIQRRVDGELSVKPGDHFRTFPPSAFVGDAMMLSGWYPDEWDATYMYETQEEYIARVKDEILGSIRPQIRSLGLDGELIAETPLIDATKLYHSDSRRERSVTTIATFDLASDEAGPVDKASVLGSGGEQVYSTADNIYVFSQQTWDSDNWFFVGDFNWRLRTNVWKFSVDNETHEVDLVAKGTFDGQVLNQFAVDEHDGYLRIVTTANTWSLASAGQSVLVLAQEGRKLDIVGRVDEIAGNEVLYSVRFAGDMAYFVTFRKVDPLFVVDLSEPTNPQLMGELHIPGYSDYLQPIDENHLLAIGRGADEATGLFQELQVSIFDVSDLSNPQLVDRYSFDGGRTTATPATGDRWSRGDGDHHAVSYFADEQILALPIYTADDWPGWWQSVGETEPIFDVGQGGLQVFQIDVEGGFTPLGIIEHDTMVERSVQIGDRLFAISSGTVSVHELTNPANRLGEIEIGGDASAEFVELVMYQSPAAFVVLAASEPTTPVVDPQVGWALPSLERSRRAQPARVAAFANAIGTSRLDAELIQLLAMESAGRESSPDADGSERRWGDVGPEDDAISAAQQHQVLSAAVDSCVLEQVFDNA
jgi:hypothetical protein